MRCHRAGSAHLPLGSSGSGPRPQHPSSTPFRRYLNGFFLRHRRLGLLCTVFLTQGHVNHLQDEGRQAERWLVERMLGNREGRSGEIKPKQTGGGWEGEGGRKKSYTPYTGRGKQPLTVVNSFRSAPFLCHMACSPRRG